MSKYAIFCHSRENGIQLFHIVRCPWIPACAGMTDFLRDRQDCFAKARELADLMGYPPLKWKARFLLSQVYKTQGKPDTAKTELEEAVAVIQKMASKVSDAEVRATFLSSEPVQAVYRELQGL